MEKYGPENSELGLFYAVSNAITITVLHSWSDIFRRWKSLQNVENGQLIANSPLYLSLWALKILMNNSGFDEYLVRYW